MRDIGLWAGRVAGFVGLLLCAAGGIVRMAGQYWLGAFQAGTLMLAGTALLAAGCFFLLLVGARAER